jgi:hypothetical protein
MIMRALRLRFELLIGCTLLAAAPVGALANTFSTDATDLWWNPAESGWGVNIMQQSNIIFATFFVYDSAGNAHWYVASNMTAASVPSDRPYEFFGPLYETTGPVFSAASFASSAVLRRQVGTASFEYVPTNHGNLTYTVDGVTATKRVERQSWSQNSFAGTYVGALVLRLSGLAPPGCVAKTGTQVFQSITASHDGGSFSMTAVTGAAPPEELCRYTGTYSQAGHMGSIAGVYSCNSGANGSFTMSEVEIGTHGFAAQYSASDRGCGVYGNLSGVRSQ